MTEVSFTKSFLTALDSRPSKLQPDHIEDAKSYPARNAYILPKMAKPLAKRQKLAPGTEALITVTLKSSRNPPLNEVFSSLPLSTSILSLKEQLSDAASIPTTKIRLLYAKKPVQDSKVLKDLVGEEGKAEMELGVMVMGGAASIVKKGDGNEMEVEPNVAQGTSGKEALVTDEFWADLKGYLVQRLRDEGEAERVFALFKKSSDAEK